jgi:tRNA pseudouridine38-40 synthase
MARYQAILAYDGTRFSGLQRQRKANAGITIQGVLEEALRCIGWEGKSILIAGRTDTGVHALGQVIAFDLDWRHSEENLRSALNAYLPEDVAVQEVKPAAPNFHPRYDATQRRYRYRLFFADVRNPLFERFAWRVWPEADVYRMKKAAEVMVGEHDFSALGTAVRKGGSTVRMVYQAQWSPWEMDGRLDGWQFDVQANAFLYHMVRRMVAVLVAAGQGRIEIAEVQEALERKSLLTRCGLAPARGLTLVEVIYAFDGKDFGNM